MVKGRGYVAYTGTVGGEGPTAGQGGLRIMSADLGQNTNIADVDRDRGRAAATAWHPTA